MNFQLDSRKRVMGTIAVIVTVLAAALLMGVGTGRGWALVALFTITAGAVLLHLTRPMAQTTSQAIQEARR
jgi:hypothetical protein